MRSRRITSACRAFAMLAGMAAATLLAGEFDHSHARFDAVLKTHVADGLVDYAALKANPENLKHCLDLAAAVTKADFQTWEERQQLAFLINLYNAATLKLIIDHYPVKSIKDIGGLFSGPWDQKVVRLFGRQVTLDHVEHELIRRQFDEPRIHFALVCAAKGCPPLRREAYSAGKLDEQLDDQGKKFMAKPDKNRVDLRERIVYLSPIFRWFRSDFEKASGSLLDFVAPYFPGKMRDELKANGFTIKYTEYDWSLNDSKTGKL